MTEMTLYGVKTTLPFDISAEAVPVPYSGDGTFLNRWAILYYWTIGIAGTDDIAEQVKRGIVVSSKERATSNGH